MTTGSHISARTGRLAAALIAVLGLAGCSWNGTPKTRPPSPNASPRSSGQTLIRDGFAPGNRWTRFHDAHAEGRRLHSGFEIRALSPFAGLNNAVWLPGFSEPVASVSTTATLRQLSSGGSYELLALECLHDPAGHGFAGGIDPARGTYSFVRLTPTGDEFARGRSRAIRGVQVVNRITFTCSPGPTSGSTLLTLVANGNFVAQRTVTGGFRDYGDVAVALESDGGGTAGVFTNLISQRP